jgi:hypothetical protein
MMKLVTYKTFLLILITFSFVMTTSPLTAQVYKTVDEDGNVTYTDQPPKDGSKPIELRPISIIEAPTYETAPRADEAAAEGEDGKKMSLKYLRKNYQDFAIVSPRPEESVWHPDGPVAVAWNARYQLQIGMKVTVYMDGNKQVTTTDQIIPISDLDRGEHTVTAELTDSRNRKIATAQPVTFFIQRPGLNTNRPRPRPRGGS